MVVAFVHRGCFYLAESMRSCTGIRVVRSITSVDFIVAWTTQWELLSISCAIPFVRSSMHIETKGKKKMRCEKTLSNQFFSQRIPRWDQQDKCEGATEFLFELFSPTRMWIESNQCLLFRSSKPLKTSIPKAETTSKCLMIDDEDRLDGMVSYSRIEHAASDGKRTLVSWRESRWSTHQTVDRSIDESLLSCFDEIQRDLSVSVDLSLAVEAERSWWMIWWHLRKHQLN